MEKRKTKKDDNNIEMIPDIIEMPVKKIIQSKTIWVNLIAFGAFMAQNKWGYSISPELQAEILAIINVFLRTISDKKLRLK